MLIFILLLLFKILKFVFYKLYWTKYINKLIYQLFNTRYTKQLKLYKLNLSCDMGHDQLLKICLLEKTGRHYFSTARHHLSKCHFFVNCLNPIEPGLTGFEQLIYFVSSSWFPAKSVDQLIVEQSNFEQFTPLCNITWIKFC